MASLQLYSSYSELKNDRVERPLTQKEKLRQQKAVQSLSKMKKVASKNVGLLQWKKI